MRRATSSAAGPLRAVLLALLAGAALPVVVAAQPAAPTACQDDLDGANDQPGQKDLTRFCLDGSPAEGGYDLVTKWNWDDVAFTGGNTGDACSLYDKNDDGLVDYAACVTVQGNPAAQVAASPRLYTCSNVAPDRCVDAVLIAKPYRTLCRVAITNDDPFPSGSAHPRDTEAVCGIDLRDFGNGSAVLIDACSFPSPQPNSAPSDCILLEGCTQDSECDDGNPCTVDTCLPGFGTCRFEPGNAGVTCREAADVCDVAETCDGTDRFCPVDELAPAGTECRPGEGVCAGTETCIGTSPACPADEPAPDGSPCDDGSACTTGDVCSGGTCVGGPPPVCDDGNVCTDDACDPATGCVTSFNTAPCDDGDLCTTGDVCRDGVCGSTTRVVCDDGNVCTDDVCDPVAGCRAVANNASCDDGDLCTTGDTCSGGVCGGGRPVDCSDGDRCNGEEICDPAAGCLPGAPLVCDDGNACTDDSCDPASGCETSFNTEPCQDDDPCTIGDRCSAGVCAGTLASRTTECGGRAVGFSADFGRTPLVEPRPDSDAPDSHSGEPVSIPGIAEIASFEVFEGCGEAGGGITSEAVAEAMEVRLLDDGAGGWRIRATSVRSEARCDAGDRFAGCTAEGSRLENVVVDGEMLGTIGEPLTIVLGDRDLGRIVVHFLEQVKEGAAGVQTEGPFRRTRLRTNGIHVIAGGSARSAPLDLVVARAEADASYADEDTCREIPRVAGHAFAAHLGTPAEIGRVEVPFAGGEERTSLAQIGPMTDPSGAVTIESNAAFSDTSGGTDESANAAWSRSESRVERLVIRDAADPEGVPLLSAELVGVECEAAADSGGAASYGSAYFTDLRIAGTDVCEVLGLGPGCRPGRNTRLLIGPRLRVTLNHHVCDDGSPPRDGCAKNGARNTGITIRGLDIENHNPPPQGNIIFSEAYCAASALVP